MIQDIRKHTIKLKAALIAHHNKINFNIYLLIKHDNIRLTKKDNIYKITRMTGNHNSFLGIYFVENIEQNLEIIEVPIRNSKKNKN